MNLESRTLRLLLAELSHRSGPNPLGFDSNIASDYAEANKLLLQDYVARLTPQDAAAIVECATQHAALIEIVKAVSLLTIEGEDKLIGCAYISRGNVYAKGSLLELIEKARALVKTEERQ